MTKIEDLLSNAETLEIKKFCDNKLMSGAVKKVLLAGIYNNGTMARLLEADFKRNFALNLVFDGRGQEIHQDNALLGQRLRACAEGLRFLENGFTHLESLNVEEEIPELEKNKAR